MTAFLDRIGRRSSEHPLVGFKRGLFVPDARHRPDESTAYNFALPQGFGT